MLNLSQLEKAHHCYQYILIYLFFCWFEFSVDFLENFGKNDITHHINFSQFGKIINNLGNLKYNYTTQKEFLIKFFDGDGKLKLSIILNKLDTRMKIVVTFLAVLDLVKEGLCIINQEKVFGELELLRITNA